MQWLQGIFARSPEAALFLSMSLGHLLGAIRFGKFQLGGVAGSLLVAAVVSQVGVQVDAGVKAILFALFIYAVGFESGPQFFRSLGRDSFREIVLALVMAAISLATVVLLARMFGLDKGLAAGIAAGGLTQSAIIGTAGDAIAKMGLAADEVTRLQGNVATGYAVTYVFGCFGAIIVCVNILPRLMGRSIREDALRAQAATQRGTLLVAAGADDDALRNDKTDFVFLGAGLATGLLIGLVSVRIGGIALTLGSGGGALLSGLLFGWMRAQRPTFGALPVAAVQILKDLGLAGFVAAVGLCSGLQAVQTIREQGVMIFCIGIVVTIVPMLLTALIGKYLLGYDNTALFAGALSGARSANPAFGEVLDKAQNAVPTVPFAITYALANVLLTLLGPLVVALV